MNTVKHPVKKLIFIFSSILFCSVQASSQQATPARFFAGTYVGVGWSTTSIFWGQSLEYLFYSRENKEVGISASHTNRYKFGNVIFLFGDPSQPVSEEGKLTATSYIFPGKKNINKGFFFTGEAGLRYSSWKLEGGRREFIRPSLAAGFGWKWKLDDQLCMRLSNTLEYHSPQPDFGGAVTSVSTLSIGF